MANREEKRNLETIPVGSLGIISLPGCKPLGEKVDQYLVKWRAERESEHKESLAFAGYQRDSYLLDAKVPVSVPAKQKVRSYNPSAVPISTC